MISPSDLSPAEREFLIQLRSLLLKAVDLIERRVRIGKYRASVAVPRSPTETIANGTTATTSAHEQTSDTFPAV